MNNSSYKAQLCVTLALGLGLALPAGAQEQGAEASPAPVAKAAAADDDIGEVIVTARRIEERLQDVPISITVFSEEKLAKNNLVNSTDLANITPSLSSNNNFGNENASFAIRGFVQDAGTPPSVGVYFADVVAPRGASNGIQVGDGAGPGNFFDLQNVQVLKGPQGTLQGRNTTGGSILFVPRKPTSDFGGYVEGSVGNYGMYRTQGAINLPVSDTLRARLAVDHESRDGYIRNNSGIGPDDFNDVNYIAARASVVWDITPNLENYFVGSYSNSDTNGSVQKLIACNADPSSETNPLGALLNGFGNPGPCAQVARNEARGDGFYTLQSDITSPRSKLKTWQAINTTAWHATDTLTAKNIISYAELTDDLRTSLFGTDWRITNRFNPADSPHVLPFAYVQAPPGQHSADQNTFTEEMQLQGSAMDERLTYQGGVYYESSRPLSHAGSQSPFLASCTSPEDLECADYLGLNASNFATFPAPPPPPGTYPNGEGGTITFPIAVGAVNYTSGEAEFRDIGIYSQVSYALTEQWKLTGGYRYTWDRQKNTSTRISYAFPAVYNAPYYSLGTTPVAGCTDQNFAPSCTENLEAKSQAATWLIDLDYKPLDNVMTYVSYKRGYRAGGIFVNAPAAFNTFKPEKVDTYELGLKTSFDSFVKGTFNVAGFYNDFTNQQLQIGFNGTPGSGNSSTSAIANAGASKIYGMELDAVVIPLKGLVLEVNYTYLKTEITKITLPVADPDEFTTTSSIQKGDPLVLSPKNKFTVAALYTLPLSPDIGKISGGPTFIHTDKQLSNYDYLHSPATVANLGGNWGQLDSRNLLNLNLGWTSIMRSSFDVSLFATNVTHEKYYNFDAGLDGAGFESATLGEPTMYGGSVRYTFGS